MSTINIANVNSENIINSSRYRFNIGLVTADGRYQELKLGAINSLVLEDDYTNFYHKGYIIINNRYDAVERLTDFKNKEKIGSSSLFTPDKGFIFKGDSRDMLIVDIMPKLDDTPFGNYESENAKAAFRLLFTFAIYNTEEVTGTLPGEKFKKLFFWDMYYELLREKNSYFSTSNYLSAADVTNLTNTERGISTGTAVKSFLKEFFGEEDGWPITINENQFDRGGTSIFFSAPARFKGIDCLNYLLSRHVSDKNDNFDQGFLRLDRSSNTFSLQSLKKTFQRALSPNAGVGELYLETFKLGIYSDANNEFSIEKVSFTPLNSLYLGKYGTINNFSYDPMPGIYSQQEVVSTLVHSYDYNNKQFSIDEERNTIGNSLSVYATNYVEPFNNLSIDNTAYINFYPGEYRFTQKNIKNVFSVIETESDQRLSAGRNKVIFSNIFLNNTVLFRVPGSTHRQAGRFIGVDRDGAIPYSDFDSKILGVYFVAEVKHIFEGNDYFNELRCIKTYSYDNLFLKNTTR